MELDDVIDAELQLRLEDTDPEDEGDSGDDAAEEEDGPVWTAASQASMVSQRWQHGVSSAPSSSRRRGTGQST